MIKCVVWDLDNTLLAGTWLESPPPGPPPDPGLLAAARELDRRGILLAVASRNPPEAARYAAEATGLRFAAAECGWGRKSDAITRILADLGLAPDAAAFVDDELIERAEVASVLPGVLTLTPQEAAQAPDWPQFSPAVLTDEGRRRGELYEQRRRRQEEARAYGGSRDDFLRFAGTRVTIAPATAADLPRLHELSARTHQLNTAAEPVTEADLTRWLADPGCRLVTVRLRDRFGDDGLVGAASAEVAAAGPEWTVPFLAMSCRALGRGVLDALLAWLIRAAAADDAPRIAVPCLITERNVPLRLALTAAGLRAPAGPPAPGAPVTFTRALEGPVPELPDWVDQ